MTGSVALDVVIGLVFIYLLYSLLATIILEAIANIFGFRAKFLEKAIIRMLEDDNAKTANTFWNRLGSFFGLFGKRKKLDTLPLTKTFFSHPLIKYLAEDNYHSKPSYLTAQNFSKTLIDLLRGDDFNAGENPKTVIEKTLLKDRIVKWEKPVNGGVEINNDTLSYLKSLWADSQGDVNKFKTLIEEWYDATMERASGWYKKHTQGVLLAIGLIVALIFNVDTLKIVGSLSKDPVLREQMVKQADNYVKTHQGEIHKYDVQMADTNNGNPDEELRKIKARSDSLINQARNLVNKDIADVNHALALGWDCKQPGKNNHRHCKEWQSKICLKTNFGLSSLIGWFITAIALSLGAPFWFDMLNKLMKLRGAVATGTESKQGQKESETKKVERVG